MVAATHTVASTLKELGYSNVYNLERLWDKPESKHQDNQMSAQGLAASEVIPFKKELPKTRNHSSVHMMKTILQNRKDQTKCLYKF